MAYILGMTRPEEREELERRGWTVEPAPASLCPKPAEVEPGDEMSMVFVDNDLFEIMSGPGWDQAPKS